MIEVGFGYPISDPIRYPYGKRHGQGKYTYKNGKVEEGEWKEGKFIG